MGRHWLAVLGCLCILVGVAHPAAVPTPDTMVVARSEHGELSTAPTASLPVSDITTEEPAPPVKLTEMEVTSHVTLRYAHTAVVTQVRNPAKRAQEATFTVLLPETAFISGFVMTLDGKSYKAYVKEKEEAKQIYNQAVSQGIGAAHIAVKARDSNQFTVSVNVEPNTVAVFNLTYEELLVRRNGVYNHAINLHPGALVPKLTVKVNIKEANKITTLRVPDVRTGNEIDATAEDPQNSKAQIEKSDNEATVIFKPDLEEQKRLISIYREKSKDTRTPSYSYGYGGDNVMNDVEGVLGQFVVQYDVDRPKNGEILVNDGYFVHFFAPSDLSPLNKHVVFVLDTSGSMMDRKIVQLREAMQTILSELNRGDYFSIVEFASSVKVHELKEADQEPPKNNYYSYGYQEYNSVAKTTLVPPSAATPENIAKAKVIVSRLDASGGTNIYGALHVAVELIQKGIGWSQPAATNDSTTESIHSTATAPLPNATEIAADVNNASADEESIKLEPIIIFLTDGDPTIGESDPKRIINHVTEKNSGPNKATIYSLAFGEDADRNLLRKLSLRNDGFMRHIYEAADAALQLRDFYRQVASPLLANVKFAYPKKQAKEVTKHHFRRYYDGSETVVAGRVEDGVTELEPQVEAFCGVQDGGRKRYEILPKVPVPVKKEKFLPLERLWAYLTIKQLLDDKDAAARDDEDEVKDKEDSPDKKALAIALKYEFVTPLTSLVVVKPNATDAIDAESVHRQNNEFQNGIQPLSAHYASFAARPQLFASSISSAVGGSQYISPMSYNRFSADALSLGRPGVPGRPAMHYPASASFPGPSMNFAFESEPFEEDLAEYDGDRIGFGPAASTVFTPPTITTFPPPTITSFAPPPITSLSPPTSQKPSALAAYHLQALSWLEPLLQGGSDEIALPVNGTTVTLKLSKDDVAPKSSDEKDEECENGIDGATGSCVYLTRCEAARDITAQTYSSHYCLVDTQYAGVCCPKANVKDDVVKSH